MPEARVVDLPYPFDLDFWSTPVEPDEALWRTRGLDAPRGDVICYAAQLVPRKRQAFLVTALVPILRARPDLRLALAGRVMDRDVAAEVQLVAAAAGVADRVHVLGELDAEELRQLYAWSTVHAITSAWESQCLVLYESLAAGVATLIPDLPALTSAFPGLPVHRDSDELRTQVIGLLDDAPRRDRIVAGARLRLPWADVARHDASCRAIAAQVL